MKKWRVGIIGVGGIFNGAHREHYLKDDRLEVVALCDIIEERAVECLCRYLHPELSPLDNRGCRFQGGQARFLREAGCRQCRRGHEDE